LQCLLLQLYLEKEIYVHNTTRCPSNTYTKKSLGVISPNRENVVKGMQTWVKVEEVGRSKWVGGNSFYLWKRKHGGEVKPKGG
jgi:hypothetical protein